MLDVACQHLKVSLSLSSDLITSISSSRHMTSCLPFLSGIFFPVYACSAFLHTNTAAMNYMVELFCSENTLSL